MFSWLKRLKQANAAPPQADKQDVSQRLLADGEPSRYVPKDDPQRFAGEPPPLHLVRSRGELILVEDSTGLLVGPTDRRLAKAGIYIAKLRGESYHKTACKRGDFAPGVTVRLMPEPDNQHDPNAVRVTANEDDAKTAAYVNKGAAKRFGRLASSGEPLRVISLKGTTSGAACEKITILAAHPDLVAHLLARRPKGSPRPQTG